MARVTWRRVMVLVEGERELVLGWWRGYGYTADAFERERPARGAMAHVLTRLEDWLELHRPRRDRSEVRAARRALESELV